MLSKYVQDNRTFSRLPLPHHFQNQSLYYIFGLRTWHYKKRIGNLNYKRKGTNNYWFWQQYFYIFSLVWTVRLSFLYFNTIMSDHLVVGSYSWNHAWWHWQGLRLYFYHLSTYYFLIVIIFFFFWYIIIYFVWIS